MTRGTPPGLSFLARRRALDARRAVAGTFEFALRDWLEDGSDRTPPAAIDAVRLAIRTTPQERDLWIPQRFTQMPTYVRLVAAVAVVAILGLGAVSLIGPGPGPGRPITTSSTTQTAVPSMTHLSVMETAKPLAGGLRFRSTIDSGPFGEPFIFTMPMPASNGPNEGLARQFTAARPDLSTGVIHFSGPWWTLRFVDDVPVLVDICDPMGGSMPDVPATPAAAREWLEADQPMRLRSWVVAAPVEVPVDGRTALRWDLLESKEDRGCGGWFGSDMLMRVYAIPTGDDTILLIGGSDMVNFPAVSTVMDEIVRSMDFR